MWLKDEFIGLEETFKVTNHVMDVYAQALMEGRDASIEQYLLTFWVKDLSIRDLMDRISITSRFTRADEKEAVFASLFSWLYNAKIEPESNPDQAWNMDDFRKIAPLMAQSVISTSGSQTVESFIQVAVKKFGRRRVRDFMEIQLIQENDLLMKFLDYFDSKFDHREL